MKNDLVEKKKKMERYLGFCVIFAIGSGAVFSWEAASSFIAAGLIILAMLEFKED